MNSKNMLTAKMRGRRKKDGCSISLRLLRFFAANLFAASALAPAAEPTATPSIPAAKAPEVPYPNPPATLPGRGLAQHDFLYSGEWDTRKDQCTMFLIRGGKVAWSY